jgi:hypothetical protein|tara:strand:+ start:868 stop:1056 length:189 start_codon:yes stop_codon:yes gene_type:complete
MEPHLGASALNAEFGRVCTFMVALIRSPESTEVALLPNDQHVFSVLHGLSPHSCGIAGLEER